MKDMIEMIEQSTETAMESARKVAELNLRTFDKYFQQQTELAAFYMEIGTRGLEMMAKAKGYQDWLAGQTALLRECNERGLDALRQGYAMANEAGAAYGDLAQAGIQQARQQAAQASSKSMKAAAL